MGMEISSGQPTVQVGGGYGNGMWGGDMGIMFLAFMAMMGGGGFGLGNRGPQVPNNIATTDTVNQAVQYSSLVDQNRDLGTQLGNVQAGIMQYVGDHYNELQRDVAANAVSIANVQAQQMQCCCEVKQEIASQTLKFTEQLAAMNLQQEQRFAALNERMYQSEIQRLRDQMAQQSQDMQDMRAEMRMSGVLRMPQGYAYNAGPGPFNAGPFPAPSFGMAAGF